MTRQRIDINLAVIDVLNFAMLSMQSSDASSSDVINSIDAILMLTHLPRFKMHLACDVIDALDVAMQSIHSFAYLMLSMFSL